jgi:hypothetical protein
MPIANSFINKDIEKSVCAVLHMYKAGVIS